MMKLAVGIAALILGIFLVAVGWVLTRPRWKWDPDPVDDGSGLFV